MVGNQLDCFSQVWLVDFEFISRPGERPSPVCVVAHEIRNRRTIRLWCDQFDRLPPYSISPDSLFVAYFASAELGCHLALNWPMPARILDLFCEFRNLTNGTPPPGGNSLLGALAYFGLSSIGAADKTAGRDLVLRGGPWSPEERKTVLDYCESDVDALRRLLSAILPSVDLPRALYRGRYMAAVSHIETTGVPVDVETLSRLRGSWEGIQERLIKEVDNDYHVFEGRTFKEDRFSNWLLNKNIPWPQLESGRLALDSDTFKEMSRIYPAVCQLGQLRHSLSEMRLNDLTVGQDGCNRCLLSPFRSRTSRNQPSNTKFIFGPSVWLRTLIQPKPDWGIAYVDWVQQEFGIAAALSQDPAMLAAYGTGDCYLAFAKQAKAVPADATKKTHSSARELFKQCVLGVQYGMEETSLGFRIQQPTIVARDLLRLHREVYRRFWWWSDNAVDLAILTGKQATVFGWNHHIPPAFNPRSIRNFHMQANGAEMLRLACCLGTENGISICAPVHDAVLITAPIDRLEADVDQMREHMREASKVVLAGFPLQTEAKLVTYPDHYSDERGKAFWEKIIKLV
jgi:DNA polymerase I